MARGFGLIEFVCAIVVLGIAMLLALKGGALLQNLRAVTTGYQLRQYQAAVMRYVAENRVMPGDDRYATQRFGREPAFMVQGGRVISKVGNGVIDGHLSDFGSARGEQIMAWNDLRSAGMVDGDPSAVGFSALPENPFGGIFGFDEGNLGQTGGSICATEIPGRAAAQIDDRLDDGNPSSGKVLATSRFSVDVGNHFPGPDNAPYDVEKTYIVCVPALP